MKRKAKHNQQNTTTKNKTQTWWYAFQAHHMYVWKIKLVLARHRPFAAIIIVSLRWLCFASQYNNLTPFTLQEIENG